MKMRKSALVHSALALLLCISMLIGSTFAWFTDTVSGGKNIITAGNLDLEMYWTDDLASGTWYNVEDEEHNTVFHYENWEPGYTEVKYIKLVNAGELALNYELAITPQGGAGKLAEVINVYYGEGGIEVAQRSDLEKLGAIGLLDNVMNGGATAGGTLLAADQTSPFHPSGEVVMTIAMNMLTTAGNDYQNEDAGRFTITALATQAPFEEDAFGSDYDADAEMPSVLLGGTASAPVTPDGGKVPAGGVELDGGNVKAFVPAGVAVADGADKLTLKVTPLKKSTTDITVVNNEILIPVDVHIDGVAEGNDVPIVIDLGEVLPKYLNMGNYHLFHVENGANSVMTLVADASALTAHNTFTYDPLTGKVSVAMASFSEVAVVADTTPQWEGNIDVKWYSDDPSKDTFEIANADQFVGLSALVGGMTKISSSLTIEGASETPVSFKGKTIKLLSDLDLNGGKIMNGEDITRLFYPVGYYNSEGVYYKDKNATTGVTSGFKTFEGTFDGNGHTISNIYQNTWEMKGDHEWYAAKDQHYRDGMGLFGRVYGGTVKNLSVDNFKSDGEITTTGVIASYADGATFENIAITNCNPRVYNIGNGGIVGCVGWYAKEEGLKTTFKNITVDNSNTISALWGSYDVPCGGIVGQYYPTSGQTSAGTPKNAGIYFENCHAAAQMDVNNDVCGNYQYYAYRYAGMLIGSVRENETIDGHVYPKMDGITAEKCTVHFGTWNDYYYCEFEKNGHPSYSGPDDYKFSRVPHSELNFTDFDGNEKINTIEERNSVTGCKHVHTAAENNQAVYLPFNNLVTGYGWGVTTKVVGDMEGVTILDREEANSVEKFKTKFTGDFLYRVGNKNTVSVGNLFKYKDTIPAKDQNGSGVVVSVEKVDESMTVGGTFTANTSDWTKGTIQFSGTGVVKVTIQDYNFCKPTTIKLEVVDAVNATTATNATANNVVLLNDCGFSSLTVSNGYALYGNGYTMTCGSDSASLTFGEFVTLADGTLDNVQIVCPNYDYAALYSSQLKGNENRSVTSDKTRYYNAKSAVSASGNSQILNSRISGGRSAVYAASGNVVIDNSRLEGGAVANIIISAANSFVMRDITLVQKPTESTYKDDEGNSKTLMGMSVLYLCNADGSATPTTLEGSLVQYAWADESCEAYMPSGTNSIISTVLDKDNYTHTVNGKISVNLGFAYMPNDGTTVSEPNNIEDSRTDKGAIPYGYESVNAQVPTDLGNVKVSTYVYSYQNTKGTADSFKMVTPYVPNRYSDIIAVQYADASAGLTTEKSYGTDGWIYKLNVDLDQASGYAVDFSKLSMRINGILINDYKVDGAAKPTNPITVSAGAVEYTLTATVQEKIYTAILQVTGVQTSKNKPVLISNLDGSAIIVDQVAWGTGKCVTRMANDLKTNYTGAAPVLQGIFIRYWSVSQNKYVDLKLDSLTPGDSQALNGTNPYWEYAEPNGDYTLKITNTKSVHTNGTMAMPVVYNNVMYFVSSSTNGFVSTGSGAREVHIKYEFKDNNGGELVFDHMWSVAYNSNGALKYADMTGTADGCFTPETLITLADGTQKRVDELSFTDKILAWDFFTGTYVEKEISLLVNHGDALYRIANLRFSDGAMLRIIAEHGIFDYDLNKFVYITADNMNEYVGHRFVKYAADGSYDIVTLVKAYETEEYTSAWSITSADSSNAFASGLLTVAPPEDFYNWIEMDGKLTYDVEQFKKDVETYGLYTYDDFKDYVTYEQFVAWNGAYLKVAVEKGYFTFEYILELIEMYKGWMP